MTRGTAVARSGLKPQAVLATVTRSIERDLIVRFAKNHPIMGHCEGTIITRRRYARQSCVERRSHP